MIKLKDLLLEKTIRMGDIDIIIHGRDSMQLLSRTGRLGIDRMDAKGIMYAVKKEFSIYESTGELNEKTIKTKSGLKIELGRKNKYELLKIYGHKGYVEFYGRPEIKNFMKILKKEFKIV